MIDPKAFAELDNPGIAMIKAVAKRRDERLAAARRRSAERATAVTADSTDATVRDLPRLEAMPSRSRESFACG